MAKKKKIPKSLTENQKKELCELYKKNRIGQREAARKYGVTTYAIRQALGIETKSKRVKRRAKSDIIKKHIINSEVRAYQEFLRGGMIDVFALIQQSMIDMSELNDEMRQAIPQLAEAVEKVRDYIDKNTNPVSDSSFRSDVYKMYGLISSFYSRGKLRIETRKELGNWVDRYKDIVEKHKLIMEGELIALAIFRAVAVAVPEKYNEIKKYAIEFHVGTEQLFTKLEQGMAGDLANDEGGDREEGSAFGD